MLRCKTAIMKRSKIWHSQTLSQAERLISLPSCSKITWVTYNIRPTLDTTAASSRYSPDNPANPANGLTKRSY